MKSKDYLRRFLNDVLVSAPGRSALVIGLMTLSSFFEGIALAMLFPLLSLIGLGSGEKIGGFVDRINAFLAQCGIGMNIYVAAGLFMTMVLLQNGFFLAQSWVSAGLQVDFIAFWRKRLTDALLTSEWLHFTRKNAGELSHVLTVETQRASLLISFGTQILSLCATAAVYFVVAWLTSWQTTLILIGTGLLSVAVTQLLVRRPGLLSVRQTRLYQQYSSLSSEVLNGMKLIRSLDGAEAVRGALFPMIETLKWLERKIYLHPSVMRSSFEVTAAAALMGTLIVSTKVLGEGGVTVLLIAALFIRLYPRVSTIQQFVHSFRMYLPFYGAVIDALDEASEAAEPGQWSVVAAGPQSLSPPSIELRSVSVTYENRPALHNVSVTIPARQTVALVGPSGAGKSTLVDALLRLVPCSAGAIYIDNRSLREIELASWRRSIGYVPQDTFLFHASIRDNIAFAQPQATMEDIRFAAQKAHLDKFIETLPGGYDTLVGDRGVVLSGGQRQRVGIARALLGGKTLLILDEATSSLDSETEAAIMRDIEGLQGKITIILIAHRLSTLRSADWIIVLEKGRVVEEGDWNLLTRSGGLFQHLWTLQSREGRRAPQLNA